MAGSCSLPFVVEPVLAILIAGLVGIVVTLIPFIIKEKTGANDFVVSIMLNYVVILFATYLVLTYFRDPSQGTFATFKFGESASLGRIIPKTRVHYGFIIAIITVILVEIFLNRTSIGYKIKLVGNNKEYAQYLGFNTFKIILISQVIGGFILGIGGGIEVLGMYQKFVWQTTLGLGWDGVIVSILAKNKPKYIPMAAFF